MRGIEDLRQNPLAHTLKNRSERTAEAMYKYSSEMHNQIELNDFDQPMGIPLDHHNRWYQLAELIPWDDYETVYASKLSRTEAGNLAKPFRMALGTLIIQTRLGTSDRETVRQIQENPYLQYFIGLPRFQTKAPFDPSLITLFRKRIGNVTVDQINEDVVSKNHDLVMSAEDKLTGTGKHSQKKGGTSNPGGGSSGGTAAPSNTDGAEPGTEKASEVSQSSKPASEAKPEAPNGGTLILDATCAPVDIRYPMDTSLLNEAREKAEAIIRRVCHDNNLPVPRMYCETAHKEYLNLAKSKKPSADKIRSVVKGQLQYLRRDLHYIEGLMANGQKLDDREMEKFVVIQELYVQQKYMYDNKVHRVDHRIVSLQMPFIRPIVRGKTNKPVEFGPKFDMSLDESGLARIEKFSYESYNETETLQGAVERYRARTGHYPERVLVDQIYRTRKNRAYCKEHGIRMSGPRLGRKASDPDLAETEKKVEYQDNTDRIAVERSFSLSKRCYKMGLVMEYLDDTVHTAVSLSVLTTNLFKILDTVQSLFFIFYWKVRNFVVLGWESLPSAA